MNNFIIKLCSKIQICLTGANQTKQIQASVEYSNGLVTSAIQPKNCTRPQQWFMGYSLQLSQKVTYPLLPRRPPA